MVNPVTSRLEPNIPNRKTVYILGAGFSIPAGGPPQKDLMPRVAKLMQDERWSVFRRFLEDAFGVSTTNAGEFSLEDIYTPIDRCVSDGVALRGFGTVELQKLRNKFDHLISAAVDESFQSSSTARKDYVKRFATHLCELARQRSRKNCQNTSRIPKKLDPVAVISLNWDILLDQQLYERLLVQDGGIDGEYAPIGVVDYCCYVSSLNENDSRIRSGLWALGSGGYNIKLLKIHGSLNWLQCENCQRLFVAFDKKTYRHSGNVNCRHCLSCEVESQLRRSLVMPTFLKDLTNFQVKLVWQNAGVELMEATKIVFIGYSLPDADFEFRQLMSRMIRKTAEIEVVLFDNGNIGSTYKEECDRFRKFFPGKTIRFESRGVEAYVQSLFTPQTC